MPPKRKRKPSTAGNETSMDIVKMHEKREIQINPRKLVCEELACMLKEYVCCNENFNQKTH